MPPVMTIPAPMRSL